MDHTSKEEDNEEVTKTKSCVTTNRGRPTADNGWQDRNKWRLGLRDNYVKTNIS